MPDRPHAERQRTRGRRFALRIHGMRMLGTALCALPIASLLAERDAALWTWLVLGFNVLVWPRLAYVASDRAEDPVRVQFRCLVVDSGATGFWVAVMGLCIAPTALMVSIGTADKIAAGGWPLMRRCTMAMIGVFLITWALLGFPLQPTASMRTLLLTIPFLFVYLMTLAMVMHGQGARIAEQKRELERLNRIDPLVQIANRRYFEELGALELARFHRSGRPASVLLIDVDRFKSINDAHGHEVGDGVLKRVAALLREHARESDLPARYGGDEFAMLLADTGTARATQVASRIRAELEQQIYESAPGLRSTLSIGVAETTPDVHNLDAWLRAADAALYRAKEAGRNRVSA